MVVVLDHVTPYKSEARNLENSKVLTNRLCF